jgi:hypothetical protein
LLDPIVRKSREELGRLLADAFLEYTSVGSASRKTEVIEALRHEIAQPRTISHFEIVPLAEGVVLATYRLRRHGVGGAPDVHSLRSSIWTLVCGEWRCSFIRERLVRRPEQNLPYLRR